MPLGESGFSARHEVVAKRLLTGTVRREGQLPITLEPVMLSRQLHGPKLYGMQPTNRVLNIQMARMSEDRSLYAALFDDPDDPPGDPDWGESGFTIWVVVWRLGDDEGKLVTLWEVGTRSITTLYGFARFVGGRYFVALLDAQLHVFDLDAGAARARRAIPSNDRSTWRPCEPAQSSIAELSETSIDEVRGLFLTQAGDRAQLVSLCPDGVTKACCRYIDFPPYGTDGGARLVALALSGDGIGAAVDGRGEIVLFDVSDDRIVARSRRAPPAPLQDVLWFSHDGRWLFYLSWQGLDILGRATGEWLGAVPLGLDSPGILVLDDQGHVDGDPDVLAQARFRVGDKTVVGIEGARAEGAESPHVPGLFERFVSANRSMRADDGGGAQP